VADSKSVVRTPAHVYPNTRIGISLPMDCLAIYESPRPNSISWFVVIVD
jgi:hypothetical protein